jgi:hypothetical protein
MAVMAKRRRILFNTIGPNSSQGHKLPAPEALQAGMKTTSRPHLGLAGGLGKWESG